MAAICIMVSCVSALSTTSRSQCSSLLTVVLTLLEPMIPGPGLSVLPERRRTMPRSEIRGEHSPLRAGLHDIRNAVKNRAQRIFSESFFDIRHIFYNLPLFISQVGWVLCITLMS